MSDTGRAADDAVDQSPPPRLPPRDPAGHKGTFGSVAILGGCCTGGLLMIGAPALAARAALRAGCGLAKVVVPEPIAAAVLQLVPSATGLTIPVDALGAYSPAQARLAVARAVDFATVLAVGPGLGTGQGPVELALAAAEQNRVPIVLDADGLNAVAQAPELREALRAHAILTPHPGEFRRLAARLGIRGDPVDPASRPAAAAELARALSAVVVLKGQGTIVTDGTRIWRNTTGSAALATGGTGDVLTGLIAGLVSQYASAMSLFDLARVAVAAHGLACDAWCQHTHADSGLLAHELADRLPAALQRQRE